MYAIRLVATLALCVAAFTAAAAQPYVDIERGLTQEQLHETGLDTLTPQQLARLNALLREKQQASNDAPDAAAESAPAREAPQAVPMDLEIRTIKSRLRGTISRWAPGTEFRLENGQTWKVLKGEITLRQPLDAPEILVVPGIAGRWFLQVHEDYPKARVYRID
jgi:hypothetical protein